MSVEKTCGRPLKHDLTGKCFGRLLIERKLSGAEKHTIPRFQKTHDAVWVCKCNCGHVVYATGGNLIAGNTKDCGNCFSVFTHGNVSEISLSDGGVLIIDNEELARVSQYKWSINVHGYAVASVNGERMLLHRYVLDRSEADTIDHINGNKNDCRKENLRAASFAENARNAKISRNNSIGYKGVYYDRSHNMYAAEITVNRRKVRLGRYRTAEEAADAYNHAAIRFFGDFARINCVGRPFTTRSAVIG